MAIRVIITNATDDDRIPVSTTAEPQGTTVGAGVSQTKASTKMDKGVNVAGLVAVQQVMPYVNNAVNFGVSQIQVTTGSAELQQRAQVVSGAVSTVASIGLSAAVGGVPGAAIAAALSALNFAITSIQRSYEINVQKNLEGENLRLKKSRVGMTVNRSRSGGTS